MKSSKNTRSDKKVLKNYIEATVIKLFITDQVQSFHKKPKINKQISVIPLAN